MADDKLIALLLNALQDAYMENSALRIMVASYCEQFPQLGDWKQDLETLKAHMAPDVRTKFSAFRDAVARSRDLEAALAEFLKETPPKGPAQ